VDVFHEASGSKETAKTGTAEATDAIGGALGQASVGGEQVGLEMVEQVVIEQVDEVVGRC
jgi:hypothetical protein